MEALIVPGAKMPNFTIRKDFQERYCVDRRHIYDYFHSRGLRVAKEDKHNNLLRGRLLKAQSQAAAPIEGVKYQQEQSQVAKQTVEKKSEDLPKLQKATKMRLRKPLNVGENKIQRRKTYQGCGSTMVLHVSKSPLKLRPVSPCSSEFEDRTSSNESPQPELSTTCEMRQSTATSAYRDTGALNSPFDNLLSFYSLSHDRTHGGTLFMQSLDFGSQEPPSLEDYMSFTQEDQAHYDLEGSVTPRDTLYEDSFDACNKFTDYQPAAHQSCVLQTKSADIFRTSYSPDYTESDHEMPKQYAPIGAVSKDDGDIDFSKWLLAIDTQDKELSSDLAANSTLGGISISPF
ncbi:hypothetical protein AX17_000108 [Amanita inopinata Kibby_2008]|nr:hypothetical protein AX17_000108 [Amanita inopinata Kibby_2008]